MSKELEALKYFKSAYNSFLKTTNDMFCQITISREQANEFVEEVEVVEKALLELESIKEANPSEALECLKELHELAYGFDGWKIDEIVQSSYIKQALLEAQKEHKALEIIKEHIKFDDRGIETYTDDFKNLVTKFLIRLESKDTGATFHIHLDTEEQFNLLKEVLKRDKIH